MKKCIHLQHVPVHIPLQLKFTMISVGKLKNCTLKGVYCAVFCICQCKCAHCILSHVDDRM